MAKPATIDEYILTFPKDVQELLQQARTAIKEAAPNASELMSYNVAAFK